MAELVDEIPVAKTERQGSRRWALAGVIGAVGGVGGVMFLDTGHSLAPQELRLRLCAALGLAGVAGLLMFVAGLRSYLDAQTPPGSLTSRIAQSGVLVTAVALFIAYLAKLVTAGYTQAITGQADVVVRNGLDELTTGAWSALAVTMAAVAVAAVRHAALPRWLGWVSAVLGTVIGAAALAGAPQAGFLPGIAWLLITSVLLARSRAA
jgi:hypothetical protein